MATSDEEVQNKAEAVEKLRQQVADAEVARVAREQELSNDLTMAGLEAEEERLKARLAVAKDAGKVSAVKGGAGAPLEAAKEQMKLAVEQRKAAEKSGKAAARATEGTSSGGASGDTAAGAATSEKGK
jgi:hypothetical protein